MANRPSSSTVGEKLLVAGAGAPPLVPLLLLTMIGFLLWRGLPSLNLALFFGQTPALAVLLHGAPV